MHRLRLIIVAGTLLVALFVGSGVAFASGGWCDWGSPPPMDTGVAPRPLPGQLTLPTPGFTNPNGKFTDNPLVSGAYLPPGMTQASANK